MRTEATSLGPPDLGGAESGRPGAGEGRACVGPGTFPSRYRILFLLACELLYVLRYGQSRATSPKMSVVQCQIGREFCLSS